jgi:hypothetical protein
MKNELTIAVVNNPLEKIAKIDEAIKKIGGDIENYVYKTNKLFKYAPNNLNVTPFDISKSTNITELLGIGGFLIGKSEDIERGAKYFGISKYKVPEWMGYPIDSWLDDLKHRIHLINHGDEIKALEELRKEVSEFVLEEDRKAQKAKLVNSKLEMLGF